MEGQPDDGSAGTDRDPALGQPGRKRPRVGVDQADVRTVRGSRGSLRQAFPLRGELLCGQLDQVGDVPSHLVQVQVGDQVQTGVGRVQRRHGRYPGLEAACGGGEVQPSRIERERINAPEPPGQRRIQPSATPSRTYRNATPGSPSRYLQVPATR